VKSEADDNVKDQNMDDRRDDCMIVNNDEFISSDEITADFDGQSDNHSNCEEEKEKSCELLLIMKILHFLLALQSLFYISEAAVAYVASNLADILEWIIDHGDIPVDDEKFINVRWSCLPFLNNLSQFLKLPEVQDDLNRAITSTYPVMTDVSDGSFARSHPAFKDHNFLKIELNSDDLNITNAVSHKVHKVFFIYWTLLNLKRDHRSRQVSKRLIAACDSSALKYGLLDQVLADFLQSITKLCRDGIRVMIEGKEKYYRGEYFFYLEFSSLTKLPRLLNANLLGALFFTIGDYPAQQAIHGKKESVSASRFCPCCDVMSDNYIDSIDQMPTHYAAEQYDDACKTIEQMNDGCSNSLLEFWQKLYGINKRRLPLDAMQVYYLYINLPHILRTLLFNSKFEHYDAILLLVDIVSLCYASEVDEISVRQLEGVILHHNHLVRKLYPNTLKQKYHFLLHLPRQMALFGPLKYTQCLASERKHQFFKGNKHRNFKNLPKTCTKRHQVWQCVTDYNADGSSSSNILKNKTILHRVSPLSQDLKTNVESWELPFTPTHLAEIIKINGTSYSIGTILCTSNTYLSDKPEFAEIIQIFVYHGESIFGLRFLKIVNYDAGV
ncbi:unnamed protein product, partial [Didymodactylos carnosus]